MKSRTRQVWRCRNAVPLRTTGRGRSPAGTSLYGDGVSAGAFGNWKTGEEWKWSGKSQSTMTSAEREQFAQKMARAKRVREAQKAENAARARERAERDWERAAEAVTHPYLVRKRRFRPSALRSWPGSC